MAASLHRHRHRANVDNFLRLAGFEELHYLRRYCAKLIYEVEAYGDDCGLA